MVGAGDDVDMRHSSSLTVSQISVLVGSVMVPSRVGEGRVARVRGFFMESLPVVLREI